MGHDVDRELIPGTEVVYRGTDGESDNCKQLVLIPAPSNNPDDPLVSRLFSILAAAEILLRSIED